MNEQKDIQVTNIDGAEFDAAASQREFMAGIPEPLPIAHNGFSHDTAYEYRKDYLDGALRPKAETTVEVLRDETPGTIVLIPLGLEPARISTIGHVIQAVSQQQSRYPITLVMSDNGFTRDENLRAAVYAALDESGIQHRTVNAMFKRPDQRNPAYARNRGLEEIDSLAGEDEALRMDSVLFVDSDVVMLPDSIDNLQETYASKRASAVIASSIAVNQLDTDTIAHYSSLPAPEGRIRRLPELMRGDQIDMGMIVAFSGDVATKTFSLLLKRDALKKIMDSGTYRDTMLVAPHGSAEDMILSLSLGNLKRNGAGGIYHDPRARALDQARDTLDGVRKQRRMWGADHVILYKDFADLGLIQPGLRVLEPSNGHWQEWVVPGTEDMFGLIINPNQLKGIRRTLQHSIETEGFEAIAESTKLDITEGHVQSGMYVIDRLVQYIDSVRGLTTPLVRTDLPRELPTDATKMRWSDHSRTGQLLGNIAGMHFIQDVKNGTIPKVILFGVRQNADWDSV